MGKGVDCLPGIYTSGVQPSCVNKGLILPQVRVVLLGEPSGSLDALNYRDPSFVHA